MDKARETAVRILYEVHENGAYANVALAKALRQLDLGEQDRRFVTELVYSTCTIELAENQGVVSRFLEQHPEFELETTGHYLPLPTKHAESKMVQLLPHIDGTDGFFICRMKKMDQTDKKG